MSYTDLLDGFVKKKKSESKMEAAAKKAASSESDNFTVRLDNYVTRRKKEIASETKKRKEEENTNSKRFSYEGRREALDQKYEDTVNEKRASFFGGIANAIAAASASQGLPTSTNMSISNNFAQKAQEASTNYSNKRQEQAEIDNERAKQFNEQIMPENTALLDSDEEVNRLVSIVYNNDQRKFDLGSMFGSFGGGMVVSTSSDLQAYNEARKKLNDMGYSDDQIDSLADTYGRNINAELQKEQNADADKLREEHPFLGDVATVGATVFEPFSVLQGAEDYLKQKTSGHYVPVDTNSIYSAATNFKNDYRQARGEDITESITDKTGSEKLGKAADFIYQTGMSIGDTLLASQFPGSIKTKGGKEIISTTGALLGTSAYAATVKDATDRGLSADKAMQTAVAAGIAETAMESLSIGNFRFLKESGRNGVKNLVKDIAKQAFVEGSEEFNTDIVNAITDQIINASNSELSMKKQEYIDSGMSEEEASKAVAQDFGVQVGQSFLGGALSGGMFGGSGVAIGNISRNANVSKLGSEIKNNRGVRAEINTGLAANPESRAYRAAVALQDRVNQNAENRELIEDDYNDLSNRKVGELARLNTQQASQETFAEAVQNEDNSDELVKAYSNIVEGKGVSSSQVKAIASSEVAVNAINEELGTDYTTDTINKKALNELSTAFYNDATYNGGRGIEEVQSRGYTSVPQSRSAEEITNEYNAEQEAYRTSERPSVKTILDRETSNFREATDNEGNRVNVRGVDKVENGVVYVKTADNTSVPLSEVNIADRDTANLYAMAHNYSTEEARAFVGGYLSDNTFDGSLTDYVDGFSQVYTAAKSGMSFEDAYKVAQNAGSSITMPQAMFAYDVASQKSVTKGAQKATRARAKQLNDIFNAPTKAGVTDLSTKANKVNKKEIEIINDISKKAGIETVIVDDTTLYREEDVNGLHEKGKILLSLNNESGLLSAYFGHELFHELKDYYKKHPKIANKAQELQDFIIERLQADKSYNFDEEYNRLAQLYGVENATEKERDDVVLEEIAANGCFVVFSNEDNINKLMEKDKGLLKKVQSFFADFLDRIREALARLSVYSKEYRSLHNDVEAVEHIVKLFDEALKEYQGKTETKTETKVENKTDYSRKNAEYLEAVENGDEAEAQRLVDEAAMAWGAYSVDGKSPLRLYHGTQSFGFTEFDLDRMDDKRSIFLTSDINTAQTYSAKSNARSIKSSNTDVFKLSFKELAKYLTENNPNKDYKGANITYQYLSKKEMIEKINEAEKLIKTSANEANNILKGVFANQLSGREKEQLTKIIQSKTYNDLRAVSTALWTLNRDTHVGELFKFNIKEVEEKIRLGNILRREIEQNPVLSADGVILERSLGGYSYEAMTPYSAQMEAEKFAKSGNYSLYAKLMNPLIVDAEGSAWRKISADSVKSQISWYDNTQYANNKYLTTRDIADIAFQNKNDGVIFKNIVDLGGALWDVEPNPADYIVVAFKPENVKSADPVTYDNDGKVVPLSERFSGSKDIRYSRKSTDSEGNELSEQQQEYFKDSKVRDDNGNLMVMYHGTPNAGFTVFRPTYFTANREYADVYQSPNASSISVKQNADNPDTYAVYLNITKPFDTRNKKERDIFYNEFYRKWGNGSELQKSGLPDWVEGEDLLEFLEDKGYDYDGLILDEGATGGYGEEVKSRGLSYVTINPEQVKNIDNKAPTDNEDIRYSRKNVNENNLDELYNRRNELQEAEQKARETVFEFTNSQEYKDMLSNFTMAKTDEESDAAYEAYINYKQNSGFAEAEKNLADISAELTRIQKRYTELRDNQAVADEAAAIKDSGLSDEEYFRNQAVDYFGYTPYFYDAGYILPNGKMLNFSGDKGKHYGVRGDDHRTIGIIYANTDGTAAMNRFMSDGNIRIMAEAPAVDIYSGEQPTNQQYDTIRKFIESTDDGYFAVDFSNENGSRAGSLQYNGNINATRIINDIKHYFATGEIREQSDINSFHYSRKSEYSEVNKVLEENEELQEAVADLKDMLRIVTKQNDALKEEFKVKRKSSQSGVDNVAKYLRDEYNSNYSKQNLMNELNGLYDYMANAGYDIDDAYIMAEATKIADRLIDNSKSYAATDDDYKDMRESIRTTALYASPEIKGDIPDYNDFRRANMGKLRLTNNPDALPIDVFYMELSDLYKEFFPEDVTSQSEMLGLMLNAYNNSKPVMINIADEKMSDEGMSREDYAYIIAADIFNQFFEVPEVKTFAAKKEAQINKLKVHYNSRIADLRETFAERLERQKQHQEDVSKRGRERRRASELRKKIARVKKRLDSKLLNPTDNSYVPVNLIKAVAAVCDVLNEADYLKNSKGAMVARSESVTDSLDKLHSQYEKLKKDSDYDFASEYDETFAEQLSNLSDALRGKQIRELTSNQLNDIYTVLRTIENTVQDAKKQLGRDEAISNYESRKRAITEVNNSTGIRNHSIGKYEFEAMNTMRLARLITDYNDDAELYKQFLALEEGQRKANKLSMDMTKPFYSLSNDKQYRKAYDSFTRNKKDVGLIDEDGNAVQMTEAQIAQLVLTAQREQGLNHLESGGFLVYDAESMRKGKTADAQVNKAQKVPNVSYEQVLSLYDGLSDYAKQWIEAAKVMFNEQSNKYINDTSMVLKHRKIATAKNYIPIAVIKGERASEIEGIKYDSTLEGAGTLKSVNQNAKQGLIIEGLPSVIDKHIDFVSKYAGLAIPVRNFNKMYGGVLGQYDTSKYKSLRDALDSKWSTSKKKLATDMIDKALSDLQTPRKTDNSVFLTGAMGKLESAWVQATLSANLSVTLKQAASYPTAAAVIDGRYLNKAIGSKEAWTDFKGLCEEIDAHTGTHFKRRMGMSIQEIAEITQKRDALINKIPAAINPMKWIQAMDCRTTATLWVAAKKQIEAKTDLKVGSDAYWEAVTNLYDECIEKTQPNYDSLHRAEIQKTANKAKMIFSLFQTQPLQNAGLLYDSLNEWKQRAKEYKADKSKENLAALRKSKKQFANVVQSQMVAAAVFSAMTLFATALKGKMNKYRDDDDEVTAGSVIQRWFVDFGASFFATIVPMFGSTIWEAGEGVTETVKNAVETGKVKIDTYDLFSFPTVSLLNDTVNSVKDVINYSGKMKDGKIDTKDYIDKMLSAVSQLASLRGIPASNIVNSVKGAIYLAEDAKNKELGKFEAGRTKKGGYDDLFKILSDKGVNSSEYKEAKEKVEEEKKAEGTEKPNIDGAMKTRALKKYMMYRKKKGAYEKAEKYRQLCLYYYGSMTKVEEAIKKAEEE